MEAIMGWKDAVVAGLSAANLSVCYNRGFKDAQSGGGRNINFLPGGIKPDDEKEAYNQGWKDGLAQKGN
jgi:hypothetical protein